MPNGYTFKCIILSICTSFICSFVANAQVQNYNIEGNLNYGIIYPHHKSIQYHVRKPIAAVNINLLKRTKGDQKWHRHFNYPEYGIGLHASNLGNSRIYGNVYALYGVYSHPFFNKDFFLGGRLNFGTSWVTKTFDIEDNHKNQAIGSHLNIYFKLALNGHIHLNKTLLLTSTLGFSHYSNGHVDAPNTGLNTITMSSGIKYYFRSPQYSTQKIEGKNSIQKKNKVSVIGSMGLKKLSVFYRNTHFTSSIAVDYIRRVGAKSAFGAGIDGFYDGSLKLVAKNRDKNFTPDYLYRAGIHFLYELNVNQFALNLSLGKYFYTKFPSLKTFYNRVGLKYYASNNYVINMTLKSHGARADFIEFGLGYYLHL